MLRGLNSDCMLTTHKGRDQGLMKTILSLSLIAGVLISGQAQAAPPVLAPYTAVYDLDLLEASHKSGIVSANGKIVTTLDGGSCAGWSTQTRMVVDYVFRRRGEKLSDSRNTSWEAADGSAFRYSSSRRVNGIIAAQTKLEAGRTEPLGTVKVRFSLPREKTTELREGTLFPQMAARKLINAALSGKKRFRYTGYEGFENGRARLVMAVIGAAGNAPVPPRLKGLRAWAVALAYYKTLPDGMMSKASFGLPEYEMAFRLFENGVIDRVTLRFDEFTLRGKLSRLEVKKPESCR